MDRILFGDNQFFGVNHDSEEKARSLSIRFKDTRAIIDVLNTANDLGIRTFMCTTHERIAEVCDHIRANPVTYSDYQIYPCMPYANKYADAVTDYGIMGALKRLAPGSIIGTIIRGGTAAARKDIAGIGRLLIDAEMKAFRGLSTPVIFLQNVVTDLCLGLGLDEAFQTFAEHVKASYGAEPGFITMNLPRLVPVLHRCGLDNPIICSSINKRGFRMNPSVEACEDAIRTLRFRPVAMSILASGALPPREAIEYVCKQTQIESIVFGASSRNHIKETKGLIESLSQQGQASPLV